jgi:hypothetical protein
MPEPAKRDPKAPKFLEITAKDSNSKTWPTAYAQAKDFSTGSVGYYASENSTKGILSMQSFLYPHRVQAEEVDNYERKNNLDI